MQVRAHDPVISPGYHNADDGVADVGAKIKIAVEFLSLRDIVGQFSEVSGEKASLALELTPEQFEASRHAPHPAAELMYLSWEFVARAGPDSGYRVSTLPTP